MKKRFMKACFFASMAAVAAGFTACSSDVEVIGQEQTIYGECSVMSLFQSLWVGRGAHS